MKLFSVRDGWIWFFLFGSSVLLIPHSPLVCLITCAVIAARYRIRVEILQCLVGHVSGFDVLIDESNWKVIESRMGKRVFFLELESGINECRQTINRWAVLNGYDLVPARILTLSIVSRDSRIDRIIDNAVGVRSKRSITFLAELTNERSIRKMITNVKHLIALRMLTELGVCDPAERVRVINKCSWMKRS